LGIRQEKSEEPTERDEHLDSYAYEPHVVISFVFNDPFLALETDIARVDHPADCSRKKEKDDSKG
jgi:hypothetical protein